MTRFPLFSAVLLSILLARCTSEKFDNLHAPQPFDLVIPSNLPIVSTPPDNPLTQEGVLLGKQLFFSTLLSGDNSMSCATCHQPQKAFATNRMVETGIDGSIGTRNSMSLVNLIYDNGPFFWDGRSATLPEQIAVPVEDPIEMHDTWPNVEEELREDPEFPELFEAAFRVDASEISQELTVKALEQFLLSLVSGNSKYDQFIRGEVELTEAEISGLNMFRIEGPIDGVSIGGADCFHCHVEPLFGDGEFRNNGLDREEEWTDLGLFQATGDPEDLASFKTPTLRNIAVTAPYMHDGRFETLEEVVEHYNSGGHASPTTSPLMKNTEDGLLLTEEEKQNLLAFLRTLTDESFLQNPAHRP